MKVSELLNELQGIKKYKNESLSKLIRDIMSNGSAAVKHGSFAFTIVPKDQPYVYKVWSHDPAYEAYLKYLHSHEGKHLIRVLSPIKTIPVSKYVKSEVDEVKAVKLEKLDPLPRGTVLYHAFATFFNVIKMRYPSKLPAVDYLIAQVKSHDDDDDLIEQLEANKKFLQVAVDLIAELRKIDKSYLNDVRAENIMLRKESELVITDPLFLPRDKSKIYVVDTIFKDVWKEVT